MMIVRICVLCYNLDRISNEIEKTITNIQEDPMKTINFMKCELESLASVRH